MEFMSSLQNGLDDLKPSLFELLSEQQLSSLLPPSLRYLLAIATHRHPRYLLRILNSFDEVYAVLMLLVERHFLRTYGGGFTENFYGLKRERVLRTKNGEIPRAQLGVPAEVRETLKLRRGDVWRNLAVMVGLPYLKRKLDESYDIHAAHANVLGATYNRNQDTLPSGATLKQRFIFYYKWFLRHIYPSVNAAYYFSLLAFNLAYLFDGSKYHSPFLWLIGTRIRRLGEADYKAIELASSPKPISRPGGAARPGESGSLFHPRNLSRAIIPRLLSSLRILLPASIFALKFLEWWHASDFARQLSRKAAESIELPPPVISGLTSTRFMKPRPKVDRQSAIENEKQTRQEIRKPDPPISRTTLLPILTVPPPTPATSHLCPICTSPIVNPTAAPSGYVYCYACIHRWVEGTHERQIAFMEGARYENGDDEGWGDEEGSREGRWESGKGRDPVVGTVVLGGTELLRRVVV